MGKIVENMKVLFVGSRPDSSFLQSCVLPSKVAFEPASSINWTGDCAICSYEDTNVRSKEISRFGRHLRFEGFVRSTAGTMQHIS